ncbi:uncharacterized protein DEA37_0011327 [Paragonimus westermani]|uniref:Uncharacterized protein n=1 Tax=Paragonimus westermani TaxID=34504 RepID=A0A5J4NKK9_9TREM|nr:uncharacterized protein DEA37_0011327 [Paragonimus westermani]
MNKLPSWSQAIDPKEHWKQVAVAIKACCEEVRSKGAVHLRQNWVYFASINLIIKRRSIPPRFGYDDNRRGLKRKLAESSYKDCKCHFVEQSKEVERAFLSGNSSRLCSLIRGCTGRRVGETACNKSWSLITNQSNRLDMWAENFEVHLGWPQLDGLDDRTRMGSQCHGYHHHSKYAEFAGRQHEVRLFSVVYHVHSTNKLCGLEPFGHCLFLQELYLRSNLIADIHEVAHLKHLTRLQKIWLEDNPCANTSTPETGTKIVESPGLSTGTTLDTTVENSSPAPVISYRFSVVRNLIHLTHLDHKDNMFEVALEESIKIHAEFLSDNRLTDLEYADGIDLLGLSAEDVQSVLS